MRAISRAAFSLSLSGNHSFLPLSVMASWSLKPALPTRMRSTRYTCWWGGKRDSFGALELRVAEETRFLCSLPPLVHSVYSQFRNPYSLANYRIDRFLVVRYRSFATFLLLSDCILRPILYRDEWNRQVFLKVWYMNLISVFQGFMVILH